METIIVKKAHTELDDIKKQKVLLADPSTPKPKEIYAHYKKNTLYIIEQIGRREEDEEPVVIYSGYMMDSMIPWVRTLSDFNSMVKLESGQIVRRFAKVNVQELLK
jgi:hypothetical protein